MENKRFLKGDRVYDIHYGWGEVYRRYERGVYVTFKETSNYYSPAGILTGGNTVTLSYTDYSGPAAISHDRTHMRPNIKEGTMLYVKNKNDEYWKVAPYHSWDAELQLPHVVDLCNELEVFDEYFLTNPLAD